MLFRTRSTQPEHFDDPTRDAEEFRSGYRQLARVNELFRLHDPYTRLLSKWLNGFPVPDGAAGPGRANDKEELSILDLGAGDGWLGRAMESWATSHRYNWKVTDLDCNPVPLSLSRGQRRIAASALALPFADDSFDVVIASQMTHHFNTDEDVIRHFQEAWRVSRLGIFITDMRRGALLYLILRVVLPLLRLDPLMASDGLLSVRKSWRCGEWRQLVARAGLRAAEVSNYYGTRVILAARKTPASGSAIETNAAYREAGGFYSAPAGR